MTTNDEQYVPSEEDFIDSWACAHVTPHDMTAEEAKDVARAFLARVRRDAAREALIEFRRTELALIPPDADEDDSIRTRQQALAWRIEMHLLGNYPEEVSP